MTLQEQAQIIWFFEGLGKELSTREIEILAADEWQQAMRDADEACQQFADAFVKALCKHTDRMMMEER